MKKWQSKEFLDLQNHWYELLAKDGFVDEEVIINKTGDLVLKTSNPYNAYRRADSVTKQTKQEYYERLSCEVDQNKYQSRIDRLIMMRVAEGFKIKEISEELRDLHDPKCMGCRRTITRVIRRYEHEWGIRTWENGLMYPRTYQKKKQNI